MRVASSFFSRHFELPYRDENNRETWIHLVHSDPVDDNQIERMLDAFEVVLHQFGMYNSVCIQATAHLQAYADEVEIQETEANVHIADPIGLLYFMIRTPPSEPRVYLMTEDLYHQTAESFRPTVNVSIDHVFLTTVQERGLIYALVESVADDLTDNDGQKHKIAAHGV